MPETAADDPGDLSPAELQRARALKLVSDFAVWLHDDRQLDPAAIGAAMALTGVANLRLNPTDKFDRCLAQALLDGLTEMLTPSEPRKH